MDTLLPGSVAREMIRLQQERALASFLKHGTVVVDSEDAMDSEAAIGELENVKAELVGGGEGVASGKFSIAVEVVLAAIAFIRSNPQLVADWYAILAFVKDMIAKFKDEEPSVV